MSGSGWAQRRAEVAAQHQLGAYRAAHEAGKMIDYATAASCVLIALVLAGLAAMGFADGAAGVGVGAAALAVLTLAYLVVKVRQLIGEPVLRFHEYEHGMIKETRRRHDVFAWSDLDVFEWPAPGAAECRVRRGTGATVDVPISDLARRVIEQVTAARLDQARRQVQAGQTVHFGHFGVSVRGLTFKDGTTPWAEIQGHEVSAGSLCYPVRGVRGFWASQPYHHVPNVRVLVALTDALMRSPQDRPGAGANPAG